MSTASSARRRQAYRARSDDDEDGISLISDDDGSPLDEIQQDALIERLKAEQNKSDMRAHQTIEAGFVAGLVLNIISLIFRNSFQTSRPLDTSTTIIEYCWNLAWYLTTLLMTPQGRIGFWLRRMIVKRFNLNVDDNEIDPNVLQAGSYGPNLRQILIETWFAVLILIASCVWRRPFTSSSMLYYDIPRVLLHGLPTLLALLTWSQRREEQQAQQRLEQLTGLKYQLKGA